MRSTPDFDVFAEHFGVPPRDPNWTPEFLQIRQSPMAPPPLPDLQHMPQSNPLREVPGLNLPRERGILDVLPPWARPTFPASNDDTMPELDEAAPPRDQNRAKTVTLDEYLKGGK